MSNKNWFHENPSDSQVQQILKKSESLLEKNHQKYLLKKKRRWLIFSGIGLALASAMLWFKGPANKRNDFQDLAVMDADEFDLLTEADLDQEFDMLTDLDILEQLDDNNWS